LADRGLDVLLPGTGRGAATLLCSRAFAFQEEGRLRVPDAFREHVERSFETRHRDLATLGVGYSNLFQKLSLNPRSDSSDSGLSAAAREVPNINAILERELCILGRHSQTTASALLRAANGLGNYLFLAGLNGLSEGILKLAYQAAVEIGDDQSVALTSLNLARVEEKLGRYAKAREHLAECETPLKCEEDYIRLCAAQHILGIVAFNQCSYCEAMNSLDRGLELLTNISDGGPHAREREYLRSDLLERKCVTALRQECYVQARQWAMEGLGIAERLDDVFRQSVHLKNLCWLKLEAGEYTAAKTDGLRGLEQARKVKLHSEIAGLCSLLARLGRHLSRPDNEVERMLDEAWASAEKADHLWYKAEIMNRWGDHRLEQRALAKARAAYVRASMLAADIGARVCMEKLF
jgi:tetratricopeptide (TPR) repeat protein